MFTLKIEKEKLVWYPNGIYLKYEPILLYSSPHQKVATINLNFATNPQGASDRFSRCFYCSHKTNQTLWQTNKHTWKHKCKNIHFTCIVWLWLYFLCVMSLILFAWELCHYKHNTILCIFYSGDTQWNAKISHTKNSDMRNFYGVSVFNYSVIQIYFDGMVNNKW